MIAGWSVQGQGSKMSRVAWSVVLSAVLVSGSCWLNAADEAPNAGLRGVLPASVPADLGGAIASLPENWKDWGAAVGSELSALYETEGADIAAQRKAIEVLRKRQATAQSHAADPKYRSILNLLVSLSGGLKRRLDVAEAALDTLEHGPALQAAKVDAARRKVVQQAQSLESYLGTIRNGSGWGKYLQLNEVRTAGATDAAATAKTRLKEKESLADAKARDFLSRPQFAGYEEAVDDYLNAVAAPAVTGNNPELRQRLGELLKSVEDYESIEQQRDTRLRFAKRSTAFVPWRRMVETNWAWLSATTTSITICGSSPAKPISTSSFTRAVTRPDLSATSSSVRTFMEIRTRTLKSPSISCLAATRPSSISRRSARSPATLRA